jgi:hypothetical protein
MGLLSRFDRLSIKQKLTAISLITSGLALVLALGAFAVYDGVTARQRRVDDLTIVAESIGINSAAALSFNVPASGEDILQALRAQPRIVYAAILAADGRVFARYQRDEGVPPLPDPPARPDGHAFAADSLQI